MNGSLLEERVRLLRLSMHRGLSGVHTSVVVQLLAALDAVEALEAVRLWIREGQGTEADATEMMDAALARFVA